MNASNSGWMAAATFVGGPEKTKLPDVVSQRLYVQIDSIDQRKVFQECFPKSRVHSSEKIDCTKGRTLALWLITPHELASLLRSSELISSVVTVFVRNGNAAASEYRLPGSARINNGQ